MKKKHFRLKFGVTDKNFFNKAFKECPEYFTGLTYNPFSKFISKELVTAFEIYLDENKILK